MEILKGMPEDAHVRLHHREGELCGYREAADLLKSQKSIVFKCNAAFQLAKMVIKRLLDKLA